MDKKKKVGKIIFEKVFKKRLSIITQGTTGNAMGELDRTSPIQLFNPTSNDRTN